MRVLVTGFGPFPGIPSNPSADIARYLATHRRVRFGADVQRDFQILPTEWAMLDTVADRIAAARPDLVLMFGVAGRRRQVTPEIRPNDAASSLKPDAVGLFAKQRAKASFVRPQLSMQAVLSALRQAKVASKLSRDAGRYLCNALAHDVTRIMMRLDVPALFVHIPMPQGRLPRRRMRKRKPSQGDIRRGAVAILDTMILQARRKASAGIHRAKSRA